MLRRKKDVALPWLKGKQEQIEHIKLDPEVRAEYDAIANNRLLYPLPKINKLRTFSDSAKIDLIIARITESSAEDKVLVFTEFKDTVFAIRDKLAELGIKAVTLTGDDSLNKRQKAVDDFQNDPNIKCFIGTTAAAGVGINLTAANLVIFSSLPWNPALKGQAEDRAYRNGQLRVVIVKILLIEDSIDTMMWNMIQFKQDLATDILNPEEQEAKAKTEFVKAMTQDAIKKASQKAAATTN
jgi:SNF2 family DNA or RNA helicase